MTEPIERIARYQDDLVRLLAALEPAERAEVLDGVREHIDAALAERPAAEGRSGVAAAQAGGNWREQLMGGGCRPQS